MQLNRSIEILIEQKTSNEFVQNQEAMIYCLAFLCCGFFLSAFFFLAYQYRPGVFFHVLCSLLIVSYSINFIVTCSFFKTKREIDLFLYQLTILPQIGIELVNQ
jgi:hypothetical protein